jgi:hypothetical protein
MPLRNLQPGIAVLFISGYPLEYLENRGMIDRAAAAGGKLNFLQKPFTAQSLLRVVRELLCISSGA